MTNFKDFINQYKPRVEEALVEESKQHGAEVSKDFEKALQYALLTPGKRLRPLLALAVMASFGRNIDDDAVKAASAIEWVHAYSLVHDDLPAMDNDAYRRGKLSVHALYGPATGVLVGDALQAQAYKILSGVKGASASQIVSMVRVLSERSGAFGMVYGQVLDMQNHDTVKDSVLLAQVLDQVYQKKTADILIAAALIGGHYQGLSQPALALVEKYAQNLGLLFQIQDDVDDYEQDEEEGVVSLVHLIGMDRAREMVDELLAGAEGTLDELAALEVEFDKSLLEDLIKLIGA
ncbi:polyprenyl synthetase family protein [Fructobacillus sp. M2-14]|uniref:Polyprenyl synthetase family protein n=1 Tax=Fructobacillus broussonetiae TaxID=2713173 RepID=A0ABS5R084_9LACO|nr:polyprenyl synthetase family protein [Fructobacillus broussonetiae]MBS9338844.1 polyprenyl synthetase family protein [Fructobacillus broussonetiae]